MNAVIGLAHLCLKSDLTAKQRDYVGKIHNAGTSLLSIINDILDFSKIEAGKLDVENVTFEIDALMTNVSTVVAQKIQDKGLELLFDVSSNIPPALLGDPLRLGQVLINLLGNAAKFTERGEIRLTCQLLELGGGKAKLQFSVKDTGVGMVIAVPIWGALSDKIGRKPVLMASAILIGALCYPLLSLMAGGGGLALVLPIQILFGILLALYSGAGPAAISEIFPTHLRSTWMTSGYALSVAIFGGFAPFIATWLIQATGSPTAPTYLYLLPAAVISLLVIWNLKETAGAELK